MIPHGLATLRMSASAASTPHKRKLPAEIQHVDPDRRHFLHRPEVSEQGSEFIPERSGSSKGRSARRGDCVRDDLAAQIIVDPAAGAIPESESADRRDIAMWE